MTMHAGGTHCHPPGLHVILLYSCGLILMVERLANTDVAKAWGVGGVIE